MPTITPIAGGEPFDPFTDLMNPRFKQANDKFDELDADTGWIPLPTTGLKPGFAATNMRYRRFRGVVYLGGEVYYIGASPGEMHRDTGLKLPVGFRPSEFLAVRLGTSGSNYIAGGAVAQDGAILFACADTGIAGGYGAVSFIAE